MPAQPRRRTLVLAFLLLHLSVPGIADDSSWWRGFCPPGIDGDGYAIAEGNGNLYVGGEFEHAGGVAASNIACWDGTSWSALGDGVNGRVSSIYLFGSEVWAGGLFSEAGGEASNRISKWADGFWHDLDGGMDAGEVKAIIAENGRIYVGGEQVYKEIDGINDIYLVARWNDFHWERVGTSILNDEYVGFGTVYDFAHFNTKLYAVGEFDKCGTNWCNHIAAFDGGNWHPVGDGDGFDNRAFSLEPWGEELYIGGGFYQADGIDTFGMARLLWGGSFGAIADGAAPGSALCLASELGGYMAVGTTDGIFKYTVAPGNWVGEIGDLEPAVPGFNDFNLDVVFLGGELYSCGSFFWQSSYRDGVGVWDGDAWQRLGAGLATRGSQDTGQWFDQVECLLGYQGELFAGGYFQIKPIDNNLANCDGVALFDGHFWRGLGSGLGIYVHTAIEHEGELVVGGSFGWDLAQRGRIARWDGADWVVLAADVGFAGGDVYDLVHYGEQQELIACGAFNQVDWNTANRIARWDGAAWHELGGGLNGPAYCMAVIFGDLYVGGDFEEAGGVPVSGIARWDGAQWHAVGAGTGLTATKKVQAIELHEGEIVIGGNFTDIDGTPAAHLAVFRGGAWQELGGGLAGGDANTAAQALKSTDVGLFVGGRFTSAGGTPANSVARWGAGGWESLGSGVSEGKDYTDVKALLVHDGELYLGGHFAKAGGKPSVSIARWREAVVPTLLANFALVGDGRAVEISWESGAAADGFALSAELGDDSWSVDFSQSSPGLYRARDENSALAEGGLVLYRLEHDGELLRSESVRVAPVARPELRAHPNPFNPRVTLRVDLPREGGASLHIFDPRGRLVKTMFAGPMQAGSQEWFWDGRDERGMDLPSGVYLARLADGRGVSRVKLLLLR